MNVLVTGGAGYIGSHIVGAVQAAGHLAVVYDDLSGGHAAAARGATLVRGDIADTPAVAAAITEHKIDAVIHMAGFIEAGESVLRPEKYFANNTLGAFALLAAMRRTGVRRIVFSSTAAVYGQPDRVPIEETDRTEPINPYGASKLCVEYMLSAEAAAHGLGAVALRYFNVAGAHPDGDIGEDHRPETHLIPLVLAAALGRRPVIKIFGDDYDTPDGTCIRDYIHVMDLAAAHVLALEAIEPGAKKVFNLGNGEGFSVRQVIDACRKVTGRDIPAQVAPRRPGDPARLVASCRMACRQLGWRPKFPQLDAIVAHAWAWHEAHPEGFGD